MTSELLAITCCPRCRGALTEAVDAAGAAVMLCRTSDCKYATVGFPVLTGTPVLIDFDQSLISRDWVMSTGAASTKARRLSLLARYALPLMTVSASTGRNAREFVSRLKAQSPLPVVLVVGGAGKGDDTDALYADPAIRVVGTDIYRSEMTAIVADGHCLPFADASVDGVWIQAVLEHVLEPERVVGEIHRVLKPNGYVYAETPFMQHVHEGAYDFTRYTFTGHRWLFRSFEEVSSGSVRGPGTVLMWSIRYWVAALFRSYRIGNIVAGLFFWLQHFDRLADPRFVNDAASGIFFFGRRTEKQCQPADAIAAYRGAQ